MESTNEPERPRTASAGEAHKRAIGRKQVWMEVVVYTIGFTTLVIVTFNLNIRYLAGFLWAQEFISLACTLGWLRITGVLTPGWRLA